MQFHSVRRVALLGVTFAAAAFIATAARAQDVDAGKRIWSQTAACTRCHGWAGDGVPEGPGFATGANLRDTSLNRETLREVVQCGVPGSKMPHFARAAYATLSCFGMNAAQVGTLKPPAAETFLNDQQLDNLVAYVFAKVVGQGPINKAVCQDYYGATSPACNLYP
jgi:mono/diheme cytochrome c family protein